MTWSPAATALLDDLRRSGVTTGSLVGLAVHPAVDAGCAPAAIALSDGSTRSLPGDLGQVAGLGQVGEVGQPVDVGDVGEAIRAIDAELRPRWVVWSAATSLALVRAGVRISTCWDVAAVHRLQVGGWRADPGRIWAHLHGLDVEALPEVAPHDLFSSITADDELDEPVRPDGHLRPEWLAEAWEWTDERMRRWAVLAMTAARLQAAWFDQHADARATATARSESTAEVLCAELQVDGLPMDRGVALAIVEGLIGPRPRSDADAAVQRRLRDDAVLRLAPPGGSYDLRSPADVKSLLRRVGLEAPDTRAWRLEAMRDSHPVVEALLTWRKAERIATTFGHAWLDQYLGDDGRLRGEWSASDGAAGRMTASAGLHNMPALMRPAIVAEAGHVFVRADLGQIEPRVLAAVSGDRDLACATGEDDLYAPVATALGVDRATAKVAVLGAMYGQTTGHGAQALRRLEAAYPVAMGYLQQADVAGQGARDLRTYGGRAIRMGSGQSEEMSDRDARSRAAARGRYGRNAMVQGAAAELFKVWAVTVRARAAAFDARVVLCLHDELLVHAPTRHGQAVATVLLDCLAEAAHRWAPDDAVRFVADVSVVQRWSEVKD